MDTGSDQWVGGDVVLYGWRREMSEPMTQVDPAWEKAMDDLTDEKANLVLALSNIIANYRKTDWSIDEWWDAMETSIAFGKFALDNLNKPEN